MIRQHDVQVLAEGTFRVVLTNSRRVVLAIDVPTSALGPLHLAFAVSAGAPGGGLSSSSEGTFDAASRIASAVARPTFGLTRDAASVGASLVAQAPFLPEAERARIEAASRTVLRARLGDLSAQLFMRDVAHAATAGVEDARRAGDALLTGTRVVSRVLDTPLAIFGNAPTSGSRSLHALAPLVKLDRVAGQIRRGDFEGVQTTMEQETPSPADAAFIPGAGQTGGAALAAGLAVLDGGGSLDVAVHTAYGAIPIPPSLKAVTDGVLEAVLSLAHDPRGLTDAALVAARSSVPSGLARQVFDTLVNLVVHRVPVTHVAEDLVGSYVRRYAPDLRDTSEVGTRAPTDDEAVVRPILRPIVVPVSSSSPAYVPHQLMAAPSVGATP